MAVAAGLLLGGIAPASSSSADSPAEVAVDALKWIQASAIRTPTGITWPSDPRDPKTVGTGLYAGTPGVVLFLLEAHHATGRDAYLTDAKLGADHLLTVIDSTRDAGLYTGLGGIGFTLGETYKVTRDERYRAGVERVVERLGTLARETGAGVEWSPVTDIISGSSGTGLFLIYASALLPSDPARVLAHRAAARLVEIGKPTAGGGVMWEMSPGYTRNMPNFSHGTAGIAYFLATLGQSSRHQPFVDAALAGAAYLKTVARTEGDSCLIFHHEPGDDGKNLFYLGWCHGPAGTARLWYRLYKVTNDREWLTWAERSARGIVTSGIPERETPGFWNNVSACCGSAGVASFFLAMHETTGKPEYLGFARTVTDQLIAKATRDAGGTRWVQAEHRVQPGLLIAQTGWMQGASGIGAWLLRLDAFDRTRKPRITLPDDPF